MRRLLVMGSLVMALTAPARAWLPESYGIAAGWPLASGQTADIAPSIVLSLTAGPVTSSTIIVTWSPPTAGTGTITYAVSYRLSGVGSYAPFAIGLSGTLDTITGLIASTAYDVQVIASNNAGSGPGAVLIGISTTSGVTSATDFTIAGNPLAATISGF